MQDAKFVGLAALMLGLLSLLVLVLSRRDIATAQNSEVGTISFSPPGGSYVRPVDLEIVSGDPKAPIIFTTDGSAPTPQTAHRYAQPLRLVPATPAVTIVRARAVLADGALGPIVSASYVMGLDATLPIVSLIVDPADLWDEAYGIYENPLVRGPDSERPAHMTFIDADRRSGFATGVGVRIHGYQSRAYAKKSIRVYFRSDYGLSRLDYPLFPDGPVTTFDKLVLHSGGQDYAHPPLTNWTLMRNQLAEELAFALDVPATHSRAALLFLNGEPWGIVQIRERIDEDFLADEYGAMRPDVLEAPESALRDVVAGDRVAWDSLMAYVENHDLSDSEAYAVVASQVDIANFIDYHILQIYAANTDWPAHNIQLFRPRAPGGRWRWLVWDSDNGYGAEGYSQVDSDMISHLLDYRHPETGGRDTLLFRKLLGNAGYRARFLSALAHHLNTSLAPASVVTEVDALAAELAPDILYEVLRWPGSTEWEANVQGLRDFATNRPTYVREHAVARFGLPGLMTVTLEPPIQGKGQIAIDGVIPATSSWQGTYFQGVPVVVTAVPEPGYVFAGWENTTLPQDAEIILEDGETWVLTARFARGGSAMAHAGDLTIVNVFVDQAGSPEGDWFEMRVNRRGGLDLRGWRITDNDTKTAIDEGSLILSDAAALASIPFATRIRVIASWSGANDVRHPEDDLGTWDRLIVLYVGNEHIDGSTDPWFDLGMHDNLVVLAPGASPAFDDDVGIAFWSSSAAVSPASFGVLQDGVTGINRSIGRR
ncbi:MAG: CotH kinase family protein [Anaerolineae bacterium]|nr:CotH kinase family protein [Anaerolineae bacterium]